MAPRGKRKLKTGHTREDAARDRMKDYGFVARVINASIKQLLEAYGEDPWYLIESESYEPLLTLCLENQKDLGKELAAKEEANQLALAEKQKEIAQEEEQDEKEQEQEQDQHVEDGTDQSDQSIITSEAVMDPSPAALPSAEPSGDFAPHSVAVEGMHCGWLSSEEDTDPEKDSDGDDDEMIQLTPEPLCEELEELLKEVSGQKKRKKGT